jgi:Ca-activated chloride channel family protein
VSFREPLYLAALAIVPILGLLLLALARRRREAAAAFASPALMPNVVTGTPGWRRSVPIALLLAALAALAVAFARPERTVAQPKREASIMLVTDVSGSMSAVDVEPDRLSAAQAAARDFVDDLPDTFRVGFVAFNQYAELQLPPTTDRSRIGPIIDGLEADGGTAMGDGLAAGLSAIEGATGGPRPPGGRPPAAIVLLSDGKNTSGQAEPVQVARTAARLGVPIYAIALGTPEGVITLQGLGGFPETIEVPPDPATLKEIARISKGRFFDAPDASELASIYEQLGTRIGYEEKKEEITAGFAGGGLLLLVLAGGLSLRWFGRPL